ncbi:MAG: condensation domain-containing protein, partial [Gordonia sp. (in: high G+C Gram-positive bacteria)]
MHEPAPASPAQRGLWFAQSITGPSPVFTIGALVDFAAAPEAGLPDVDRLLTATRAATGEADLLASRFADVDGTVTVLPTDPVTVTRRAVGADTAIDDVARHAVSQTIDITTGPCATVTVLSADHRVAALIVAHHLILDAYGLGLLVRRIGQLYDDPADPRTLRAAADLPTGFDSPRDGDAAFWAAELDGIDGPLTLGTHARSHRVAGAVHTVRTVVPGAGAMTRDPGRLTAAIGGFCGRWADTDDVVLGFPMMNRFGSPAANCVCSVVNVVPLRLALPPHRTLAEIAAAATARIRTLGPHARYRGEDIVRDLRQRGVAGAVGPTVNLKPFSATVAMGGHT